MSEDRSRVLRRIGLVVGVGVATGALTQSGQSVLPDGWSQAANAISPWLLVAFLVGAVMPDLRWAAAAGIVVLLFALVGYYGMIQLRYGYGGGTGSWIFWGLGAVVGGPVFGVAGRSWRVGSDRQRAAAIGLLCAVAITEGVYHLVVLDEAQVAAGFVIVGLLVPLVFGRSAQDRIGGYVAAVPIMALGALGYVVFMWIYERTSAL